MKRVLIKGGQEGPADNADVTTDDLILKAAEKIILSDRKAIDS